jgi:hypothetical protein
MPAPTKNPLFATIAPATKLENCGAMMRNVPTQVRTQPRANGGQHRPDQPGNDEGFIHRVSCPFAGMTRIRFKGFFSAPKRGHP